MACFALATAGVVGAAVWVLFGSRLLVIRSVTVIGIRLVPRSEVLAVAGVEPGTPLIRVNTAEVAARIDTITQIQGVQVSTSWPDRVVIAVRERTPALAVVAPGGFDLIDAYGVVVQLFRQAPRDPAGLHHLGTRLLAARRSGCQRCGSRARRVARLAATHGDLGDGTRPGSGNAAAGSGVTVVWGGPATPRRRPRSWPFSWRLTRATTT